MPISRTRLASLILSATLAMAIACGGKQAPIAKPTPAPPVAPTIPGAITTPNRPPPPPTPVPEPPPIIVDTPVSSDPLATMVLDDINRQSPLKPVFFALDSDEIDATAQQALADNAVVLKKYGAWAITIEGHCDERGTAEYNLALGERRALSAKSYLLSLGIPADRVRTVSYGKEFPFDPGHDEAAWSKNRRGHFVVTAK